jgi:hypothetical protein
LQEFLIQKGNFEQVTEQFWHVKPEVNSPNKQLVTGADLYMQLPAFFKQR